MDLPDRISHRVTWGSVLIVAVILLWAWLGSRREHEGCYALGDELVLQIGHQGAAVLRGGEVLDRAGIKEVRPIRGYLFDLSTAFSPEGSADGRSFFEEGSPNGAPASTRTIVVSKQWAEPEKAIVNLSDGRRAEYPLADCKGATL